MYSSVCFSDLVFSQEKYKVYIHRESFKEDLGA